MSQYFDNVDLKSNIEKYKTRIFDKEFCFNTDNGVFSKSKLDFGTRCLLENLPLDKGRDIRSRVWIWSNSNNINKNCG